MSWDHLNYGAHCAWLQIWYCAGRTADGLVTGLINCPLGTLVSDNCSPGIAGSRNCSNIIIPDFEIGPNLKS